MIKNALVWINKIQFKTKRTFLRRISKYFYDVAFKEGRNTTKIYQNLLHEYRTCTDEDTHLGLEKAVKIIGMFREGEAKLRGWK